MVAGAATPLILILLLRGLINSRERGATCFIADWTDKGLERSLNAAKRRDEVLLLDQRAQKE